MSTFLFAFGLLLLVTLGMAIGVIARGRSIEGSCGGLNTTPGVDRCLTCRRMTNPHGPDGARPSCPKARKLPAGTGAKDQNG